MAITYNLFFQKINEYYGENKNKTVNQITQAYIKKTYPEKALGRLLVAIYKTHRSSWGYPDVAAIEIAHDKFIKSDKADLKRKDVREYREDLHITDDEWKKGFHGMEVLKKAVEIGFNEKISERENIRLDPEIMDSVKRELLANS